MELSELVELVERECLVPAVRGTRGAWLPRYPALAVRGARRGRSRERPEPDAGRQSMYVEFTIAPLRV